jgi:pSer/pThr/pTyr-binding forkhead associated (FHA) protein
LIGAAFCETCGAALPQRPHLIVTNTGLRLPIFNAGQTAIVVGRSDALSGVSPDLDLEPYTGELAGLSRHHARLMLRNDQCWIEDLNSVNWTYLNNQRLAPEKPALLKDGDLLRLGNVLLTFRAG